MAMRSIFYTEFTLQSSVDGKHWQALAATGPERRDRPNAYFQLPAPVRARYVRYVHGHVGAAHLAISDLRVFGDAGGRPPAAPQDVQALRSDDPRMAKVELARGAKAVGYNVRWGALKPRPAEPELTRRLLDRGTTLQLRALNTGVAYDMAVEAFDENGVSALSTVVHVP